MRYAAQDICWENDMINKARRKFILWAMIAMTAIVVILAAAVNVVNWNLTDRNLSAVLRELAEAKTMEAPENGPEGGNGGEAFQKNGGEDILEGSQIRSGERETGSAAGMESQEERRQGSGKEGRGRFSAVSQYGNRYFILILDSEGQLLAFTHQNDTVTEEDAMALVEEVRDSGQKEGYTDEYKYLVYEEQNGNILLCFLDCSINIRARDSLLLISVIVGAAGILLGFLFILFMSGKTVEPVKESIEKQKQFVTNASHELKTPLSAIATNMDILTMDLGENEWVEGTQKQVRKMRKLVENLVSLSKLEEEDADLMLQTFCISDVVRECTDGFESIARMMEKYLETEIEEGLYVQGDPGMVQQMISILCDNALKYASGMGPVEVRLQKEGRHVVFSTANPWEQDVDPDQLDTLFERFYRGDPARASEQKSAGHGLGLSIARAMAEKNKARLTVSQDEGDRIVFRVVF